MKGSESDPHRDDFDIVVVILANFYHTYGIHSVTRYLPLKDRPRVAPFYTVIDQLDG